MPVHEVAELFGRVLAPGVGREEVVEVAEHLLDPLAVLGCGVLEGLLHPREALVEHLAAEEVLDLLVLLAGAAAAPGVVGQLGDRGGRRRRGSPSIRSSAKRASSSRSRASCLRSASTGLVEQAGGTSSSVPPSKYRWSSSRRRCTDLAGQLVEARPEEAVPCRRSSRIARSGEDPAMTSSPMASRASRRSTGGASR